MGAELCQEDEYLLELVRYIHLNPVRAGVVKSLGKLDRVVVRPVPQIPKKGLDCVIFDM